jgi:hypothetical protein
MTSVRSADAVAERVAKRVARRVAKRVVAVNTAKAAKVLRSSVKE